MQQDGLKGFLVVDPAYFKYLSIRSRQVIRRLEGDRYEGKMSSGKHLGETKIVIGNVELTIYGRKGNYEGDVNEKGEAHGNGTFTNKYSEKFKGTF